MPTPRSSAPEGVPTAQPDLLGDAATQDAPPQPPGRPQGREDAGEPAGRGEAPPGQDENQAGFVKDADKRFSP